MRVCKAIKGGSIAGRFSTSYFLRLTWGVHDVWTMMSVANINI